MMKENSSCDAVMVFKWTITVSEMFVNLYFQGLSQTIVKKKPKWDGRGGDNWKKIAYNYAQGVPKWQDQNCINHPVISTGKSSF